MGTQQAHLSYRERVAQERLRITEVMASRGRTDSEAWARIKVTKRVSVTKQNALLIWDSLSRSPVASLNVEDFVLDSSGVSATLNLVDKNLKPCKFQLSIDPVYIGFGVFVAVDALEPVKSIDSGSLALSLLLYSEAGTEGIWPEGGYAVGKSEEL